MIQNLSEFLKYLASREEADMDGIPALDELSKELGINRAALREQVAVARALGLVSVKPRTGTRRLAYTFTPALQQSLGYALLRDKAHFDHFSDLRNHVEISYFQEAAAKLTDSDIQELKELVEQAWEKLRGSTIQIPHEEHRNLHILIYRRLDNIFVTGLLEAYWEAYEATGLSVFTDYTYLTKVWQYHSDIVDTIYNKEYDLGLELLLEHTKLITTRPNF